MNTESDTKKVAWDSPFLKFFPFHWEFHGKNKNAYSITQNHHFRPRVNYHHINHPINKELPFTEKKLLTYTIDQLNYDIYTVADLLDAAYPFNKEGISNIRGDLAERVSRRIMKRFLQTYDQGYGKLGGLFNNEFNPKEREGFIVANAEDIVLKIGKYPNMILLKKTGSGKWGYQHITDLDGIFDYRYGNKRHIIILESKAGKIDLDIPNLYSHLFVPLKKLFTDADFTYVLFSEQKHLFIPKFKQYRILQSTPTKIHTELKKHNIPTLFFDFTEKEDEFYNMSRHLVATYKIIHSKSVNLKGSAKISNNKITFTTESSSMPYLELKKNPKTGEYKLSS
jgi:hypothetical protein|tara:strand:+ start:138 stop:1154 length:1017 start_codon:yes stop_codon:yes gene_type:complete